MAPTEFFVYVHIKNILDIEYGIIFFKKMTDPEPHYWCSAAWIYCSYIFGAWILCLYAWRRYIQISSLSSLYVPPTPITKGEGMYCSWYRSHWRWLNVWERTSPNLYLGLYHNMLSHCIGQLYTVRHSGWGSETSILLLTLDMPCNFSCYCCHLLTSFKINFFEKFCQEHWVSNFGSRAGPTLCRSWSGSRLFAKVISRWQKVLLARKELTWFSCVDEKVKSADLDL